MIKKEYIAVARIVRECTSPSLVRERLEEALGAFFAEDNPRFDRARWAQAVNEGLVSARRGARARPL